MSRVAAAWPVSPVEGPPAPNPSAPGPPEAAAPAGVIEHLGQVCARQGVTGLAARLEDLRQWIAADLEWLEAELARLPRGPSLVHKSAHRLLDLGGKHLRPICVALAARLGTGFGEAARDCAVAVELIHNASLLHDDVIDLGSRRRGARTARAIYGNAASVVAGNWLLVTALERVRRTELPGIMRRTLATIDEMIAAEAVQLGNRGRLNSSRADYFRVIQGKTAALFRWALFQGGVAGGLSWRDCVALEGYGSHLGMAFQLVDDLLDYTGEAELTGKPIFADLREGKMTYPFLLALERDPSLGALAREILERPADAALPAGLGARVREALLTDGGVDACRALAGERVRAAIGCLEQIEDGPGRAALVALAEAVVARQR
jgi:octaprenyl-diphosphate synthase